MNKPFDGPIAVTTMASQREFVHQPTLKNTSGRVRMTMVIIIGTSKQYIPLDIIEKDNMYLILFKYTIFRINSQVYWKLVQSLVHLLSNSFPFLFTDPVVPFLLFSTNRH